MSVFDILYYESRGNSSSFSFSCYYRVLFSLRSTRFGRDTPKPLLSLSRSCHLKLSQIIYNQIHCNILLPVTISLLKNTDLNFQFKIIPPLETVEFLYVLSLNGTIFNLHVCIHYLHGRSIFQQYRRDDNQVTINFLALSYP